MKAEEGKAKKSVKKKVFWIVLAVILAVLLIPIPMRLKDGGTLELKAILYEADFLNRLDEDPETGEPRIRKGFYLDVLGMTVIDNTYLVDPAELSGE